MVKIASMCFCFLLGFVVLFDSWADAGCPRPCLLSFFKCVRSSKSGCCVSYKSCMKETCGVPDPPCSDNNEKRSEYDIMRGNWNHAKRASWDETKPGSWDEIKRGSWNKKRTWEGKEDSSDAMLKKIINEKFSVNL
ncbi:uncharacterized protein LOC115209753 [Argonauta hians]